MNLRAIVAVSAVVLAASCGTRQAACDSTNCATGCCDAAGQCQVPTNLACGTNGSTCSPCQVGSSCLLGVCNNASGTGGGSGATGGGTGTTGGGTAATGGGSGTIGGGTGTIGGGSGATGGGVGTTGGGSGAPVVPISFTGCSAFSPCFTTIPTTGPLTYVGACVDATEQARYTEFFDRNCGSGSTQLVNWSGSIQGTTTFTTNTIARDFTSTLGFTAFITGSSCGSIAGCAAVQSTVTSDFGFTGTCNSDGSMCTCTLSRTSSRQTADTMVVNQTSIEVPSEGRAYDTCGSSGAIRYRERPPTNVLDVPEIGVYTLTPYP